MDEDKTGTLNEEEWVEWMTTCGSEAVSEEEARAVFALVDDGDGQVHLTELLKRGVELQRSASAEGLLGDETDEIERGEGAPPEQPPAGRPKTPLTPSALLSAAKDPKALLTASARGASNVISWGSNVTAEGGLCGFVVAWCLAFVWREHQTPHTPCTVPTPCTSPRCTGAHHVCSADQHPESEPSLAALAAQVSTPSR